MFRTFFRSSNFIRASISSRSFHSTPVVCASFKDIAKEAAKGVEDTVEHSAEVTEGFHSKTGSSLGTSTGRIADDKSGSTPGYTPNTPPEKSHGFTKNTSSSTSSTHRPVDNASTVPNPGSTSATNIPGNPGTTGPIPTKPGASGSSIGGLGGNKSTTTTTNTSTTSGTRKYSTSQNKDIDTSGILKDLHAKIGGILGLAGAPLFTKGENVIDLIKKDHRKVEGLYKEFTQTSDAKKKQEISRDIIKNLVQHSEVEQMIVYPLLKMRETPNGQKVHDRSLNEHQEVRELLYQLDQMKVTDSGYDAKLKQAMDAVTKHVAEEESETLPLLAKKYSAEELSRAGTAFETHKYTAPTRPHPGAPMQGPAAAVAGMAAKPIDLARDAMEKLKK